MARIKVIVTDYRFNRPSLMSENEYHTYKQIFKLDPNFKLAPKFAFWDEFAFVKWAMIIFLVGLLLSLVWEPFGVVPALIGAILFFAIFNGTLQSMWNYQIFLNKKNLYYKKLKHAIITSKDYNEFSTTVNQL